MNKVNAEQASAALERIRAGETTVGKESRLLGFKWNGPLRKAIIELTGREKYFRLIYPKSGGRKKRALGHTT